MVGKTAFAIAVIIAAIISILYNTLQGDNIGGVIDIFILLGLTGVYSAEYKGE